MRSRRKRRAQRLLDGGTWPTDGEPAEVEVGSSFRWRYDRASQPSSEDAGDPLLGYRIHFQPGTRPACSIHSCISGPSASSRVFTLT
jgi:hypothetical protein